MANVVEGSEMTKVVRGKKTTSLYHLWVAGTAIAILTSSMQAFGDAEPEALRRCADVENGPQCPVDDEVERNGVVVFFDFDEDNFGAEAQECVCGTTILVECDESLPAGEMGTCAGGELQKLPVMYELIKNPASRVCKTIDGKRICVTTD